MCIFCKIANKEIPSAKIFEDENFYAFKDINPQSKIHILLIPKKHIETLNEVSEENALLLGQLLIAAKEIAKNQGIEKSGYRTIFNCNKDAGMEVNHLHLHILGGEKLGKLNGY